MARSTTYKGDKLDPFWALVAIACMVILAFGLYFRFMSDPAMAQQLSIQWEEVEKLAETNETTLRNVIGGEAEVKPVAALRRRDSLERTRRNLMRMYIRDENLSQTRDRLVELVVAVDAQARILSTSRNWNSEIVKNDAKLAIQEVEEVRVRLIETAEKSEYSRDLIPDDIP